MQTILGVWAHPDDESYLSGGLMAAAVRRGDRVVVVTATKGDVGGDAAAREQEMAAAMHALGVKEHRWLDYCDGELHNVPADEGAQVVGAIVAEVRPDLIVTFGPGGMTGHSDHSTVSEWTTAAWRASGSAARLCYPTYAPSWYAQWGETAEDVGIWMSDLRPRTPIEDIAITVACSGELLEQKLAALRAHGSQTDSLCKAVGDEAYGQMFATEWFVDAARVPAQ